MQCQVKLFVAVLFAIFALTQAADARGLKPTPRDDYDGLSQYDPSKVIVRRTLDSGMEVLEAKSITPATLPTKYDLSDYLPKPGNQRFQDCTAWAVARGAYSYQIGRSRGRRPAEKHDLFSPTFIYPQINGGADDGSFIYRTNGSNAVDLVRSAGCASEATLPYDDTAQGFTTQPNGKAKIEAKHFTAIRHERLKDLKSIKQAIFQNIPVVLAIYTDTKFYDAADTSIYEDWSGNLSGAHAICAVGFDDSKQALKLMNSWGDSWKNDGFCWVDYYLLSTIDSGKFCFEAHLIQVVDENPPRYAATNTVKYELDSDGAVLQDGVKIHAAGYGSNLTSTKSWPYVLRPDGRVFSKFINGSTVTWEDITSANAPVGLGGQEVAMFAATGDYLYAMTTNGRVYARIPGTGWDRLDTDLPNGEKASDLRLRQGKITIVTQSGRVFKRSPGQWNEVN